MEALIKEEEEINISELPQTPGWYGTPFYNYKGTWYPDIFIKGAILFHNNFVPQSNDILLSSIPKCGTTWLKALLFSILTRSRYTNGDSPLLSQSPQDLVPFMEEFLANGKDRDPQNPLVQTHVPFSSLPKSVVNSDLKIVYICRDPKDVLVSCFFFASTCLDVLSIGDVFEMFCNGVSPFGPYWDHVLGYWKASLEYPGRVLFLKYEELKNETGLYVKKMADFMGCGFSKEEETSGAVERIVHFCSFENLTSMNVNKFTTRIDDTRFFPNASFFRKGEIGDWKNHLTPQMAEKVDQITFEKFNAYGLHL